MAATDLHVNITWDTEPTEAAKDFVRIEVLKTLKETFQDASWFQEFVRREVHKALDAEARQLGRAMQRGSPHRKEQVEIQIDGRKRAQAMTDEVG